MDYIKKFNENIENIENVKNFIFDKINTLRNRAIFTNIESTPEDFMEGRYDWESLADDFKETYYALLDIEDYLKSK